ncbi:MAG: hypothetical protein ABIR66_09250, partial [Saprospiraceae bacterium]
MPRLENLDQDKLEFLRKNILETFYKRVNPVKMVEPVTYLGAYEELRNDIIGAIPDLAASISTTRLRKLFHYTNPLFVSVDEIESMSFGKDFIEAVEAYIELNKEPAQKTSKESANEIIKPNHNPKIYYQLFGLVGLITIGFLLWKWSYDKSLYALKDGFDINSL